MTVWLQTRNDGYFLNHNTWIAFEGFSERGQECKQFQVEQLHADLLPLEPGDIICGGVGTVHEGLRKLGHEVPPALDYPEQLRPWFGRQIKKTTWGEVSAWLYKTEFKKPIFVKPTAHKTWTGVLVTEFKDLIAMGQPEPDFPVWTSTPVEFVSEYRCMILNNELRAMRIYKGDPFVTPRKRTVETMIEAMRVSNLAAYSLDVGVIRYPLEEAPWHVVEDTLLVEVNDCYALGCYGPDSNLYAQMLEARWEQMARD